MDGTIGSPESILVAEMQAKVKIEVLADLEDMKIYNTVGDLSTRTDLLKNRRDLLRAFFMASGEAIALGKKNRALVQKVITRHMKVTLAVVASKTISKLSRWLSNPSIPRR
jgi:ABC-type nitrate/sulfonate/bicarbonate transport system substrate-binding protein